MKVCLYLEGESMLKCSGIGSAVCNQRKALDLNGVEHTSNVNEDFDIIHINIIGPKSLLVARRMRKKGRKVVLHAHTTAEDFRNSYRFSNEIAPAFSRYLAVIYNHADPVFTPSKYAQAVLRTYGVKREIKVLSNGVDIDHFKYSEERRKGFRAGHFLEGIVPFSVGHFFIRKGIETFANVAKAMSDYRFMWVGRRFDFPLEDPRVTRIVKDAPLNLTFVGPMPKDEIVSAYCSGDVFMFPSLCETQGMVVLEAFACKRPVLLRDIPAYNEWFTDGFDCIKARDDSDFQAKLKELIDDPKLANKLAENGYKTSRGHSLENIGAQMKAAYEEVLKK